MGSFTVGFMVLECGALPVALIHQGITAKDREDAAGIGRVFAMLNSRALGLAGSKGFGVVSFVADASTDANGDPVGGLEHGPDCPEIVTLNRPEMSLPPEFSDRNLVRVDADEWSIPTVPTLAA